VIEAGSWIGLGALILPGVTIGGGSVVAAGAVVTEAVPAHSYVEGNPARVVRQLPWADR
jgi:acetyltransferase-like isoleucine patch superfamily enzyme